DAEREREHGHAGEAAVLKQLAESEANISQSCFAKAGAPDVTTLLAHALHIAKAPPRGPRRFLRGHASRDVLRRAQFQMQQQFFVNLPLHRPRSPGRAKPAPEG